MIYLMRRGVNCLGFAAVGLILCVGCSDPIGDSEARGRNKELDKSLAEKNDEITELKKALKQLTEEKNRLAEQVAAASGGKGIEIEVKQKALDARKSALDLREQQVDGAEARIVQRERNINTLEKEFYEKTNMTMTDIGEARHVKSEYEGMRAEKDAAVAKAEWWLKFVWGVSILFGISLLGITVLLYRSISMHAVQRRDLEYRREVAQLLGTAISNQLPPDQASTIVQAFDRIAGLNEPRAPKLRAPQMD